MWRHTMTHGRKVKGKLANGVGIQYPSQYLGTWCIQHYYADAHTLAASSRLNWRPRRFKWTRPFRRKTNAYAITFQPASTTFHHTQTRSHVCRHIYRQRELRYLTGILHRVLATWPTNRPFTSDKANDHPLFQSVKTSTRANPLSYSVGTSGCNPVVKRPVSKSCHSPPSST